MIPERAENPIHMIESGWFSKYLLLMFKTQYSFARILIFFVWGGLFISLVLIYIQPVLHVSKIDRFMYEYGIDLYDDQIRHTTNKFVKRERL